MKKIIPNCLITHSNIRKYLSNWNLADVDSPGSAGSTLNTGVLRRKYNFGDRVSELAIPQTPFFRFVSKVGKNPTDDPSFKFTERRPSFHKRYSYVVGHHTAKAAAGNAGVAQATITANSIFLFMAGDYKVQGNIQNVQGQAGGKIDAGDEGTAPDFYLPKQIVKVPMSSTADGGVSGSAGSKAVDVDDYMLYQIDAAEDIDKGYLCKAADSDATVGSGTDGAGVVGDFVASLNAAADKADWLHCTRIKVATIKSLLVELF